MSDNNPLSHYCQGRLPYDECGPAVDNCYEDETGMWVGNGEYESRVNYCPYCGAAARQQIPKEEIE